MHGTIKTLSDLLHLHCGTASQIISGLKIVSLNSRVFCSPGVGPNVAVLHVDDSNFASGLRWVPIGIHMHHDIIKQKIKHVWTSTKTKKYISKSYMQIKRAKTVAEYLSSACRTATFSTIPGLH
jgi:hypothetical protein